MIGKKEWYGILNFGYVVEGVESGGRFFCE